MNYQEHKEFFDKRHSKKNNYRNMKTPCSTRVTMDGDNVVLTYGGRTNGTYFGCKIVVRPDDHFYIHMPSWNQGGVTVIQKLTGITLSAYRKDTIKESRRIWLKGSCWTRDGVSVPWIDGTLYYGKQPVELEKHIDYKRGFDPVKRLEIQRKVRDMSKAARAMAVMDAFSPTAHKRFFPAAYAYEPEIAMLNDSGVTSELIERTCGAYVNNAKADWYYNRPHYSTPVGTNPDLSQHQKKKRIGAVKNALENFTKALYVHADAYIWTEVKP